MGNSNSVPYPRYGWCISPQTTDHCPENHVQPASTRRDGSTKRRSLKSRQRRSVSAVFSFSADGGLPSPGAQDDGADLASLDLSSPAAQEDLIDINAATEEELMTLSGINRVTARAIVDYRRQIGGFRRVGDLAVVSGVGAARLQQIRPEIYVGRIPRYSGSHGMTRNSSASSSGIDMSADSVSHRSVASHLQHSELAGQQSQQPGQQSQQLGQQSQQLGLQPQQLSQQISQPAAEINLPQKPSQSSFAEILGGHFSELSLEDQRELEILTRLSKPTRTCFSNPSLKSPTSEIGNRFGGSRVGDKTYEGHRPRAESTSTRRSFGALFKSKRRQSPSSKSERVSNSGKHSRQQSATFTDIGASLAGCAPAGPASGASNVLGNKSKCSRGSSKRATHSTSDILSDETVTSKGWMMESDLRSCTSYKTCPQRFRNRGDMKALGRIESSPCHLGPDEAGEEEEVMRDFLHLYGPLLQRSRRPETRSEVIQGQGEAIRVAAWDLDGCDTEKVSNPGVREVIALTVLENQIAVLALHNLTDGAQVLKTICDELNNPTVPSVRRWSVRRSLYHCVTPRVSNNNNENNETDENSNNNNNSENCGSSVSCGFIYDMAHVSNVRRCLDNTSDIENCSHLLNNSQSNSQMFTVQFEIWSTKVSIAMIPSTEINFSEDFLQKVEEERLIVIGHAPERLHGNLVELCENGPITEENTSESGSTTRMWVNSVTSKFYSGQTHVIREGLTSPWIPQGWGWGGSVSQHTPLFSEFILLSSKPSSSSS